ncbi:MAG: pentapeptide repeat-containing protein [Spirochaetales bacterium]|nr:pentapeptide repeat-containing protein [Spirochaetales bacterium]
MAIYENYTKELLLRKYRESGGFSHDEILNNDLTDISFKGIQLDYVHIKESFLDRALLSGMKCSNVTIEQSNCTSLLALNSQIDSSRIMNSNLIKADFSSSILNGMYFENSIAHSIRFSHARITASYFNECQMYKSKFDHSILIKVFFQPGTKGDLSTLQKADFSGSMIIESSFYNINCIGALFDETVFIGCNFIGAHLDEIDRSKASFINCTFEDKESVLRKMTNSPTGSHLF